MKISFTNSAIAVLLATNYRSTSGQDITTTAIKLCVSSYLYVNRYPRMIPKISPLTRRIYTHQETNWTRKRESYFSLFQRACVQERNGPMGRKDCPRTEVLEWRRRAYERASVRIFSRRKLFRPRKATPSRRNVTFVET